MKSVNKAGKKEFHWTRFTLLRYLDTVHQELSLKSVSNAPRGGTVPAGGGEWMDSFFRAEAIRGCMGALRRGTTLKEAIAEGRAVSEISVQLWNKRREYQVHRWEKTAHDFLDRTIQHFQRQAWIYK